MLPVLLLLWLWCGYLLGFVTFAITHAADASSLDSTNIDPELYDKAIMHAKTMSIPAADNNDQSLLLHQLQEGNIEALYTVAQSLNSRNAGDDRITSVQLWHALADGPAVHVPSAVALGFSYSEVDKELALRYFIQASHGKEDTEEGGPHQAAMFNAGRLFLELNDAASSLAYIRGCANLEITHPAYATQQLTQTCAEAYNTLSTQIQSETISPPGIEDAAQLFLYSSIKQFPVENTKEFATWTRGMEYLEMYAAMVREGKEVGDLSGKKKGQTYLLAAQQELEQFRKQSGDGKMMSELQQYLLNIILGRIQFLMTAMEVEGGGADEL